MWKFILSVLFVNYVELTDIPGCNYFDTVDLTKSNKLSNGSYVYEKLIIPVDQTGEYNYEILVDGQRIEVPTHLRGCACKLGTCIRFCCPRNLVLVDDERECTGDINTAIEYDPNVEITLSNGTKVIRNILNDFVVQQDLPVPCSGHFHINAEVGAEKKWTLFEVRSNKTFGCNTYAIVIYSRMEHCTMRTSR